MEWSPCTGYLAHPFRKIGSEETLMAVTCWFLRTDTLLLRSLTLILFVSLL